MLIWFKKSEIILTLLNMGIVQDRGNISLCNYTLRYLMLSPIYLSIKLALEIKNLHNLQWVYHAVSRLNLTVFKITSLYSSNLCPVIFCVIKWFLKVILCVVNCTRTLCFIPTFLHTVGRPFKTQAILLFMVVSRN